MKITKETIERDKAKERLLKDFKIKSAIADLKQEQKHLDEILAKDEFE